MPPGSMALGIPARSRPMAAATQAEWIDYAVTHHTSSAKQYADGLRRPS